MESVSYYGRGSSEWLLRVADADWKIFDRKALGAIRLGLKKKDGLSHRESKDGERSYGYSGKHV